MPSRRRIPAALFAASLLVLAVACLPTREPPGREGNPQQTDPKDKADAGSPKADAGQPGSASALRVASWNLEWFGDTTNGPTDEALQLQNVAGVMADAGMDLWGLEEVVSPTAFEALRGKLPGYDGFVSSDSARVPNGNLWYSAGEQKVAVLFKKDKVELVSASLILTSAAADFAGRPPMRVDLRVRGPSTSEELTLIVLHLKAFADVDSYDRRAAASTALKGYLDGLAGKRVLVVGDWNDDVDRSITFADGGYRPSPFQNFLEDDARYSFATKPLSLAGIKSTASGSQMIDHHLGAQLGKGLELPGTVSVLRPDGWNIPGYKTNTSDHYPVAGEYAVGVK